MQTNSSAELIANATIWAYTARMADSGMETNMTQLDTALQTKAVRPDAEQLRAWRSFLGAHAAVIERIERDLAVAGRLPLGSYDVLIALAEASERRLRMSELAAAVVLNRSTLTRRVDRLEREGLLTRERFPEDKRGAYAVLTE